MADATNNDSLRRIITDPLAFYELAFAAAGLTMADFQRERFAALSPALIAVATGQMPPCGRFFWEGTKGSSKDSDLALVLIWLIAFAGHPVSGMIGAADAEQAAEILRAVKGWLRVLPQLQGRIDVQRSAIVCEATESKIDAVAADVMGGAHGRRDQITIINELSHVSDARFEAPRTWADNADKLPAGVVIVATNAGFIDTEAYKWREIARESADWSFHQYAKPVPWLSEKHLAEARHRNPPERFARLFYGVWSHGTGNALDVSDVHAAIHAMAEPHTTRTLPAYIGSLDLGIKHDRSAFVVAGLDVGQQQVQLAHAASWSPADYGGQIKVEDVKSHIVQVHQALQFDGILYDPWQAEFLAEQLVAEHGLRMIPWPASPANLDLMARELLEGFKNRLIVLYQDEQLISDLFKLSIIERQIGYRLEAKRTKNDHADTGFAFAQLLPTAFAWMKEIAAGWHSPGDVFSNIEDEFILP